MKKHSYLILIILLFILIIMVSFPFGYRREKHNRYIPNMCFKIEENNKSMKCITVRNYNNIKRDINDIKKHTKDKYIIKKGFIYNTIEIKYKKK